MTSPLLGLTEVVMGWKHPLNQPLTLSVYAGQTIYLSGNNGSGKTTLIKTILNIHKPFSGTIVSQIDRQTIGYVPQVLNINCPPNILVRDLIEKCYKPFSSQRDPSTACDAIASRLGIDVSQKYRSLSMGQQKLVAIAQALVNDPSIIMLDEPFCALDKHSASTVIAILSALQCTKIYTTHDAAMILEGSIQVDIKNV